MTDFYRSTVRNVLRIYRCLKENHGENGFLTVSEIAKQTGLHKWTVSRTIDLWMQNLTEVVVPEELEEVGLKVKLVKLVNPGLSEEQVIRVLRIRL